MSEQEKEPIFETDHENSPTCACKPRLFEACLECAPFTSNDEFMSAISVQVGGVDGNARRPEKSKGCWKCGGDGVLELTAKEYEERGEYEGPPIFLVHR